MFVNWYDIERRSKDRCRGKIITAQIDWELNELVRIYEELAPRHVLEIGTQYGGTLWHWLNEACEGAVIVNIDIFQTMTEEEKVQLPDTWNNWVKPGTELHTLIGRSDELEIKERALEYLDHDIDFLFIDAVHTYEGAKADFESYGPFVYPGGVIALHDLITPYFSPHIQVGKLWKEIQEAGYQTRELKAGASFGGIGVIYI